MSTITTHRAAARERAVAAARRPVFTARRLAILAGAALLPVWLSPVPVAAGAAGDKSHPVHDWVTDGDEGHWAMHQETTATQTFTLQAGAGGRRRVEIQNYEGAIRVHAGGSPGGNQVSMSVKQVWAGDAQAQIDEARRTVRLETSQPGGGLRLYVDGPFRSRDGGIDFHGWRSLGYAARFDFDVEVPADVDVVAKTVQRGAVTVTGVSGHFDVGNVNGRVQLENVGGAGSASTVNGSVGATFSRVPREACRFHTVNGEIDVTLPTGLAADLTFKTLNGEVYTDFPYTLRDIPVATDAADDADASRHGSRQPAAHHYKSRGEFAARIGAGGPQLDFATINGNILIHRRES